MVLFLFAVLVFELSCGEIFGCYILRFVVRLVW